LRSKGRVEMEAKKRGAPRRSWGVTRLRDAEKEKEKGGRRSLYD